MIRRLALALALLAPAAGLAQNTGEVLVIPAVYGLANCTSSDSITVAWQSLVVPLTTTTNPTNPDFYRILVSTSSGCEVSSATVTTGTLVQSVTASGQTQRYPGNPTTAAQLFALAGYTTCGSVAATIYVCVQHWPNGGGGTSDTPKWSSYGTATMEIIPPPVPVAVQVLGGDSSLQVTWSDGPANTVAAASYVATAVNQSNAADTHSATSSTRSVWIYGLTNGDTYDVTVVSISAGGNTSAPSTPPATGTPWQVNGFWAQYKADGGHEEGGCGGGPAGLVSLLGVALGLRGLRRRS